MHVLAPGYSSPRPPCLFLPPAPPSLPKLFPASECFFFCLSHFLFSGSFQLPSVSCSSRSRRVVALFPSGRSSLGSGLGMLPLIWPQFRWLCCVFGWKTAIMFVKKIFGASMRGLSWIGTKESSRGIRKQEMGRTERSILPCGLRYQLWGAPDNYRVLIFFAVAK